MPARRKVPGIRPYDSPAGGWGALRATARAVREQMDVAEAPLLLYRTNKPTGFDCPGCAWPDKEHTSTFQFCENGAKAVTWEATKKRVTEEFLATHKVSALAALQLATKAPHRPPLVVSAVTRIPISGTDA